ncbi:hypothetical protein VDGD_20114 [Verticillium dahliae]|nr:hypothetical protein VDGD_20114 [Verticillium dahliae]
MAAHLLSDGLVNDGAELVHEAAELVVGPVGDELAAQRPAVGIGVRARGTPRRGHGVADPGPGVEVADLGAPEDDGGLEPGQRGAGGAGGDGVEEGLPAAQARQLGGGGDGAGGRVEGQGEGQGEALGRRQEEGLLAAHVGEGGDEPVEELGLRAWM